MSRVGQPQPIPKTTYDVKLFLYQKLSISGQKDLLKHLDRERLAQGGWLYALRWACIEYIKTKGTDKVNVSHMLSEMVPLGKKLFHQSEVRQDIRNVLRDFALLYFITDDPGGDTDCDPQHIYKNDSLYYMQ